MRTDGQGQGLKMEGQVQTHWDESPASGEKQARVWVSLWLHGHQPPRGLLQPCNSTPGGRAGGLLGRLSKTLTSHPHSQHLLPSPLSANKLASHCTEQNPQSPGERCMDSRVIAPACEHASLPLPSCLWPDCPHSPPGRAPPPAPDRPPPAPTPFSSPQTIPPLLEDTFLQGVWHSLSYSFCF